MNINAALVAVPKNTPLVKNWTLVTEAPPGWMAAVLVRVILSSKLVPGGETLRETSGARKTEKLTGPEVAVAPLVSLATALTT